MYKFHDVFCLLSLKMQPVDWNVEPNMSRWVITRAQITRDHGIVPLSIIDGTSLLNVSNIVKTISVFY